MSKKVENKDEKIHMLIDGRVYNVTEFMRKHPGGSIIKFYKGMDATDAFHAFHNRSEKAKRLLKSLPSVEKNESEVKIRDDSEDPEIVDFRKLREELEREGKFKPLWGVQILRTLEVLLCHFLAFYFTMYYSAILGGLFYGITIARNGFLMHDMGWTSFSA